ncbi:WW domain-containing protein, putative isoform 5 [Hibiscus syriacus]|uniref:WW domain-containing protein, putative isoform 5 n=2 Tax=Hibiscus syriacus TaxID=106335 RepID=A0A6A2ZGN5_HIBSY|nr:WW domain-containing protein, putative isoform 5 [Hibiscus syriacus]
MSNAGRRVKLDLFVEPPEDLGGSSVQGYIDGEPKHIAGLLNSQSSPAQQPPNPLLLLGQYSDDELDEELDKRQGHGTLNDSLSDHDDKVKGPVSETWKNTEADAGESLVNQLSIEKDSTPNSIQNLVGIDNKGDIYVTNESVMNGSTEQDSVAGASEVQATRDVGSGWRIVMHEESNQYYYWNTETGETSWEVPTVLNQINQSTSQVDAHDLSSTVSAQSVGDNVILQSKVYDNEAELDEHDGGCKNEAMKDKISDVIESDFQSRLGAVDTCLVGGSLDHSGNSTHDVLANDNKTVIDLSIHLLRQGECLLERLKSLKV